MQKADTNTSLVFQGVLKGHNGWVTSIVTGNPPKEGEESQLVVSGSRDKTLMIWKLTGNDREGGEEAENDTAYGYPLKCLTGHSHFVSDLALSNDNYFCLSSSWDKTLRLWDLRAGKTTKSFVGHNKEVLSCTFSNDNRQIISTGADRTIKLWNTLADCKFTSEENNHTDWVSCIRYSPVQKTPYFATGGWDGRLKVWNQNFLIKYSFKAHEGNINSISIAPLGLYIATAGKDNVIKVWELNDLSQEARRLQAGASVNQIAFNPKMQWIAAATDAGVKIFDLTSDSDYPILEVSPEKPRKEGKPRKGSDKHACTSLAWSSNGTKLFAGFNDNLIRVYHVNAEK